MIGSDPEGRLGEAPHPELREHGRISGACFDAARGIIPGLKVPLLFYLFSVSFFSPNSNNCLAHVLTWKIINANRRNEIA